MRQRPFARWLLAVLFTAATSCVFAADLPPDVLVKSRWIELTRADFDRALTRVPKKLRSEFTTSPKRVQMMLDNLVVMKTLAAQARAHGTRPVPVSPNPDNDPDRPLAAGELARIQKDAERSFDEQKAAFEAKARERYAVDRKAYLAPPEVRLSDIAIEIKDRGEAAALARAKEARAHLAAGEDFAKVAREYSDDQTTRDKGGALPFVTRKQLAKEYADGVFALTRVGEISAPIKAPSAYHVVRLEERRPERELTFDEAHDRIMAELRTKFVGDQRDVRMQAISNDDTIEVNQPAVDALVTRVDPALLKPKKLPPAVAK
jgi:peptidyl-prolyl cis-trans isomerase C